MSIYSIAGDPLMPGSLLNGPRLPRTFGFIEAALDPDAALYLRRVEIVDGQPLEAGVKRAVSAFVRGCKADGIWAAIKASCLLCGARTLAGALVPLKGTAPTNNNFVSGDYNRATGLEGDGSTKYLNTNRNANADPQNDFHLCMYGGEIDIGMGRGGGDTGATYVNQINARVRSASAYTFGSTHAGPAALAVSRQSSTEFTLLLNGSVTTASQTSQTTLSGNIIVFGTTTLTGTFTAAKVGPIAFYSLGTSLDVGALGDRVTALVAAIQDAI